LKRQDPLPALTLDRGSPTPLHRQLADAVRLAIRRGGLRTGTALPSTRRLAATLGVSRNTVLTAYEELAAEGLLGGRRGSATRVCGVHRPSAAPDPRTILRGSHYPVRTFAFEDPDGQALYGNDPR
jgi:GntR family transcriptional regulator/MocR family aminotransferase